MFTLKYLQELSSNEKGLKKIGKLLEEAISKNDMDEFIEIVKKSGITIKPLGADNDKHVKILEKLCEKHSKLLENSMKWKKTINESNYFNQCFFNVCSNLWDVDKKIESRENDLVYLASLELMIRNLQGKSIERINKDINIKNIPENDIISNLTESTGTVLNYISYKKFCANEVDIKISQSDISISVDYMQLAIIWDELKRTYEGWAISTIDINKTKELITFDVRNDETKQMEIAKQIYFDMSFVKEHIAQNEMAKNLITHISSNYVESHIPLAKNIVDDLLFTGYEFKLGEKDELQIINILDIVKSYGVIDMHSRRFLDKTISVKNKYKINEVCLVKSKKFWIKEFVDAGVEKLDAEVIFDFLVFNKSRDLLDCPLYQVGDLYVVVPSLSATINPIKSAISNLNSKSYDISKKGIFFENHLAKIVTDAGFKNKSFHIKKEKEYECDLIFEINGHVFIAEAKNVSPMDSYRDFESNQIHYKKALSQVKRIEDYFVDNNSLAETLGIDTIKSINRIIVSSLPIGGALKIVDTILTDELYFSGFFKRRSPRNNSIRNKRLVKSVSLFDKYYTGEITCEKFNGLITEMPYHKYISNDRLVEKIIDFSNMGFEIMTYRIDVDTAVYNPDEKTTNAMLKTLA